MIQETTIIHFQALAAALMGFDYFLRDKVKNLLESQLTQFVSNVKKWADITIKHQKSKLREHLFNLIFGAIAAIIFYFCYVMLRQLEPIAEGTMTERNILVIIASLCLLGILKIYKGILGIVPYSIPVFARLITSFLLYCPKGSIGGLGMLFLAVSFLCRYINLYEPVA